MPPSGASAELLLRKQSSVPKKRSAPEPEHDSEEASSGEEASDGEETSDGEEASDSDEASDSEEAIDSDEWIDSDEESNAPAPARKKQRLEAGEATPTALRALSMEKTALNTTFKMFHHDSMALLGAITMMAMDPRPADVRSLAFLTEQCKKLHRRIYTKKWPTDERGTPKLISGMTCAIRIRSMLMSMLGPPGGDADKLLLAFANGWTDTMKAS